jgi:hypothetical protein
MKYFKDTDYEVSEDGKVYRDGKVLKPYLCKNGYYKIVGSNNGQRVHIWIHKAVGELYVPNRQEGYEILHLNGDSTDNHFTNLIWTTRKHICLHTSKILKRNIGEDKGAAKLTEENVRFIRSNYIPRDRDYGVRGLARQFDVTPTAVSKVVRNTSWTHVK